VKNEYTKAILTPRAMKSSTPMLTSSGLPTLPGYVFRLNKLLSQREPDMETVIRVIRTDASLAVQVLRLANLYRLEQQSPVMTVADAVTSLGAERLQTLVLTCPVLDCASNIHLWVRLQSFWQHNFMTAVLSESIARFLTYDDPETAYTAGLLRNIGELSLIAQCNSAVSAWPAAEALDNVRRKRSREAGRRLAIACKLAGELVEVCGCDSPAKAWHDPLLVKIVASASRFCESNGLVSGDSPRQLMANFDPDEASASLMASLKINSQRAKELVAALCFMFQSLTGSLEFDNAGLLQVAFSGLKEEETPMLATA
jgi:hypothetical protein